MMESMVFHLAFETNMDLPNYDTIWPTQGMVKPAQ